MGSGGKKTFKQSEQMRADALKIMERSGLRFEPFCLEVVSIRRAKKNVFLADVALQNMVETMLPDGLETSGRRAYR